MSSGEFEMIEKTEELTSENNEIEGNYFMKCELI